MVINFVSYFSFKFYYSSINLRFAYLLIYSGCSYSIFVSASLLLTLTFVAVGISFFGPYWISNLGSATNETEHADPPYEPYLPYNKTAVEYPHRGLWAQCGHTCLWFWNDDFRLQNHLFTPLGELELLSKRRPTKKTYEMEP